MIGKIRIKITHGIFIEDVLSDAYNARTSTPANNLVIRFTISAYSFSFVIIITINAASSKIQNAEKHSLFTPFFDLALPSKVSFFMYITPSIIISSYLMIHYKNGIFFRYIHQQDP